jgi:hypothetical protein
MTAYTRGTDAMTITEAASTAETFLRAWLAEHHPPMGPDAPGDEFDVVVKRVTADGDRTLSAEFGVSIPLGPRELRPADRINGALRAMLDAHRELRQFRLEVTAGAIEDDA